jgi:DNA-binding CsgD family transcriptional regulator
MGAHLLAAESRYDAALVWRQAGKLRHAAGVERDAEQLAAECPGVITPALQIIEPRSQLTRSERETALLAAAGHTNRRIADLQHLSIRTVENRLQLVYSKLGVAGRKDLAGALEVPAPGTATR